jgi:hypothetical protein
MVMRKIYLVQPTYRDLAGRLAQSGRLLYGSLALPALSAAEFRRRGKTVIFGGPMAWLSDGRARRECDAVVLGHPGPTDLAAILGDALAGRLAPEYRCGMAADFPFDYSVLGHGRWDLLPVTASLGCRGTCAFCCTASLYGGGYRHRALDAGVAWVLREFFSRRNIARRYLKSLRYLDPLLAFAGIVPASIGYRDRFRRDGTYETCRNALLPAGLGRGPAGRIPLSPRECRMREVHPMATRREARAARLKKWGVASEAGGNRIAGWAVRSGRIP